MRGNMGCPCERCKGEGKLHGRIRAILESFELVLGCEMVIASGYRCASYNAKIGGKKRIPGKPGSGSRHMGDPLKTATEQAAEKVAYAVDYWPDDVSASKPKWKKLYRKRHTFEAFVSPWWHYSYINQDSSDNYRKWSVHSQLL